jgi:hypothetical protein
MRGRSVTLGVALAIAVPAVLLAVPIPAGATERPADEARVRVSHHLQAATHLHRHLEGVLNDSCPRFATRQEWDAYFDGEIDRVVSLLAHMEQAWAEAKTTDDDDVRRFAKAPRKQFDKARARALLAKLHTCATANGSSFNDFWLWRRVAREIPRRRAEIALPQ